MLDLILRLAPITRRIFLGSVALLSLGRAGARAAIGHAAGRHEDRVWTQSGHRRITPTREQVATIRSTDVYEEMPRIWYKVTLHYNLAFFNQLVLQITEPFFVN